MPRCVVTKCSLHIYVRFLLTKPPEKQRNVVKMRRYGQKRGLGRRTEVSKDDGGFKTEAWDKRRRR